MSKTIGYAVGSVLVLAVSGCATEAPTDEAPAVEAAVETLGSVPVANGYTLTSNTPIQNRDACGYIESMTGSFTLSGPANTSLKTGVCLLELTGQPCTPPALPGASATDAQKAAYYAQINSMCAPYTGVSNCASGTGCSTPGTWNYCTKPEGGTTAVCAFKRGDDQCTIGNNTTGPTGSKTYSTPPVVGTLSKGYISYACYQQCLGDQPSTSSRAMYRDGGSPCISKPWLDMCSAC